MTDVNNTYDDIDMTNYRISFRNSDDLEIDWFRGTTIGIVKAGESKTFIIDSSANLEGLDHLYYEEFRFVN